MAIVGGSDAGPGEFPSVAEITFGQSFLCTGTLISPTYVLTAGHCGSVTGAAVASPAVVARGADRRAHRLQQVRPGQLVPVAKAIVEPDYLATSGNDITLLQLSRPADARRRPRSPARARARCGRPGTSEQIVGWGTTSEGGDTPDTLQKASVPITTDADCAQGLLGLRRQDDGLRRLPAGRHRHLPGRLGRPDVRRTPRPAR